MSRRTSLADRFVVGGKFQWIQRDRTLLGFLAWELMKISKQKSMYVFEV
jgi:hypothetical protein